MAVGAIFIQNRGNVIEGASLAIAYTSKGQQHKKKASL
jgi:hypothetical protein